MEDRLRKKFLPYELVMNIPLDTPGDPELMRYNRASEEVIDVDESYIHDPEALSSTLNKNSHYRSNLVYDQFVTGVTGRYYDELKILQKEGPTR